MNNEKIITGLLIASVLLLAGCAQAPSEVTSTSSTVEVTTTAQASTAASVSSASSTTTKTSTTSSTSTTKPLPPLPANITSSECYSNGFFWCAGKCSRSECGDCKSFRRCIMVNESNASVAKVEIALDIPGHEGSCDYFGNYSDAGGKESYCDINEGTLLYAKCGVDAPSPLDCYKLSGGNQTNRAAYTQRSFHSKMGPEYDLWCFRCEVVT